MRFLGNEPKLQFPRWTQFILEAGCGRRWTLDLSDIRYILTGVDIDKNTLEYRKEVIQDLDHNIVGDLRSVNLEKKYDVIYSAYVLEHVNGAKLVFENCLK